MAGYGDHLTLKLADRVQQHVRGSLRTSARSRLAERTDHRPGELEGIGPRTSDDGWPTGLEQRIHRRGGLPRPVELLANFGRGDLGRLPYLPAAVHVHIQAALLDRKSTRLNSSHANISYAVFRLTNTCRAAPALHARKVE